MTEISIIILNYNGRKFNVDCINSVLKQTYQNFEIIFVDNCSVDGSLEEVEKIFKKEISTGKIKIVKNAENTGFDGGNNLGVKHAGKDSKYICLLNNDTTVENNWLEELIRGIQKDKKIGCVGSLILNKGREEQDRDNILKYGLKPELGLFGEVLLKNKDKNLEYIDVTNVSGCSLMYKKELLKRPFEDYYFAYWEDNYLGWNLLYMGYSSKICTKSIVHHYGNGTSKTISDFCLFHDVKNMMINYYLFFSWYNIILLLPLIIIKDILQCLSLRYKYPFYILKFKFRGLRWIIKNFNLVKETKKNNRRIYKIKEKEFIRKVSFKLPGIYLGGKGNLNIMKNSIIFVVNLFYEVYGYIIQLINMLIIC